MLDDLYDAANLNVIHSHLRSRAPFARTTPTLLRARQRPVLWRGELYSRFHDPRVCLIWLSGHKIHHGVDVESYPFSVQTR